MTRKFHKFGPGIGDGDLVEEPAVEEEVEEEATEPEVEDTDTDPAEVPES